MQPFAPPPAGIDAPCTSWTVKSTELTSKVFGSRLVTLTRNRSNADPSPCRTDDIRWTQTTPAKVSAAGSGCWFEHVAPSAVDPVVDDVQPAQAVNASATAVAAVMRRMVAMTDPPR